MGKKISLADRKIIMNKKIHDLNMQSVMMCQIIKGDLFFVHKKFGETKLITDQYFQTFQQRRFAKIDKIFIKTWNNEQIKKLSDIGLSSDHPYVCLDYKTNKSLLYCLESEKERWMLTALILKGAHPFKKKKQGGTSTGETSVVSFLNKLLNTKFKKVRPDWLKNPKTGQSLELDGYCPTLNIAIEYGSHELIPNGHFFKDQPYTKFKDKVKVSACHKRGVTLLLIPDLKSLNATGVKDLIKSILEKNKVIFDEKKFQKLTFKFLEVSGAYGKDQIWAVVKTCKNRSDFEYNKKGYWRAAERLGIIQDIVTYFRELNSVVRWTEKSVMKAARDFVRQGKSYQQFNKQLSGAYKYAHKYNFLSKVKSLFPQIQKSWGYWMDVSVAEPALKQCRSRTELIKKFSALAKQISSHPEIFESLLQKYPYARPEHRKTMTDKEIKDSLKGITLFVDVYKKAKPTWEYLNRTKQMDQYTSHLLRKEDIAKNQGDLTKISKIKAASKFNSMRELKNQDTALFKYIQRKKLVDLIKFKE